MVLENPFHPLPSSVNGVSLLALCPSPLAEELPIASCCNCGAEHSPVQFFGRGPHLNWKICKK